MQEFFNIALGFPTIFWTVSLGVVAAYWLFVILGALDIELLDLDLDLDLDADLDLDLDADLDLDVDVDADIDGDFDIAGANPLMRLAVVLGVGRIPVTILLTLFAVCGWSISYFGMLYAAPLLKLGDLIGGAMLAMSIAIAIPLMGAIAHPLKGVFRMATRDGGVELIGQVCQISTMEVSDTFGQARFHDGGAGLLLSVRCESDNSLRKGSEALIIGHDRERNIYFIEPYEQFLAPAEGVGMAMTAGVAAHRHESINANREG